MGLYTTTHASNQSINMCNVSRTVQTLWRPNTKQQLLKHWEFLVIIFRNNIIVLAKDFPGTQIEKFNKVLIKYSISLGYNVDNKGARDIQIKITGHEIICFPINQNQTDTIHYFRQKVNAENIPPAQNLSQVKGL